MQDEEGGGRRVVVRRMMLRERRRWNYFRCGVRRCKLHFLGTPGRRDIPRSGNLCFAKREQNMCASGENGRFAATVASGGFLFAAVRLRLLLPLCFYIKRLFVYACTLSLFNVFF